MTTANRAQRYKAPEVTLANCHDNYRHETPLFARESFTIQQGVDFGH